MDPQHLTELPFSFSTIVYETGPRVGLYFYGGHILTGGWHSSTTFGYAATAAAASKLLTLPDEIGEDAL